MLRWYIPENMRKYSRFFDAFKGLAMQHWAEIGELKSENKQNENALTILMNIKQLI